MSKIRLRDALISKNISLAKDIAMSNLRGIDLVTTIYEIICASVLVKYKGDLNYHPVCVMNSIKNIIGDDRDNPSKSLINFAINYFAEFNLEDENIDDPEKIIGNDKINSAFIGDLENAYQQGNWAELKLLMCKTFVVSDRSRAVLDVLVEFALQNSPKYAIFTYHILRAYQFQERKEDNWVFIQCMFEQLRMDKPAAVHKARSVSPDEIRKMVKLSEDLIYFSAIDRIWGGDYVRIKSYRRELSHWLNEMKYSDANQNLIKEDYRPLSLNQKSFINFAEKIIVNKTTKSEKGKNLVILDAIRYASKNVDKIHFRLLCERYNKLIR